MGYSNVKIILFSWKSTDSAGLAFGCFITFLISMLSVGYGTLKKNILKDNDGRLVKTTVFFFGYFLKMIVMLLMMTMSVWANIAIALGTAFGFLIF